MNLARVRNGLWLPVGNMEMDSATGVLTSGTAYFTCLGKLDYTTTVNYINLLINTGGSGAQTAEVGLFSTPTMPQGANQTVSKIAATATLTALTGGLDTEVRRMRMLAVPVVI